jgi:hypothetical protein
MCPSSVSRSFLSPYVPKSLSPCLSKFADYFRPPAHNSHMMDEQTSTATGYGLRATGYWPLAVGNWPLAICNWHPRGPRFTTYSFTYSLVHFFTASPSHGPRSTAPRFTSSPLHFFAPSLLHFLTRSTIHCSRSTVSTHDPRSTTHCPRFTVHDPRSTVHDPLSTVHDPRLAAHG